MAFHNNMLILKGKPCSDYLSCELNTSTLKYDVVFANGKRFSYNKLNVKTLTQSENVSPDCYCTVKHGRNVLCDIGSILSFKDGNSEYWRVTFKNGATADYDCKDLKIEESVAARPDTKEIFEYLKRAVHETGLTLQQKSIDEDSGTSSITEVNILEKQYEKIEDFGAESAAGVYLSPDKFNPDAGYPDDVIIFPFGCNESQLQAVTHAVTDKISIISGPPGTGKTQTILNIIANLVIRGKTVQIVSNNNSAVSNVIEKLASPQYNLDFIAAFLGKTENKEAFVANQKNEYPDLAKYILSSESKEKLRGEINERSETIRDIYNLKNRKALLHQELSEITIEQGHLQKQGNQQNTVIKFGKSVSTEMLMDFIVWFEDNAENDKIPGFFDRLKKYFAYGIKTKKLFGEASKKDILFSLYTQYYSLRTDEINKETDQIEARLKNLDADKLIKEYTSFSMKYFRAYLADRYGNKTERRHFTVDDFRKHPDEFVSEYPVVLSTTYTSRSSLRKTVRFDCVIMDESSQVDIATGFLALSCADNAVVVGDVKQLPNVIKKDEKEKLDTVFSLYSIPKYYNLCNYSFLSSLIAIFGERITNTTLREHYRCNPFIAGFFNKQFYNNELIVMNSDETENALSLVTTVEGNFCCNRVNRRQIDVIQNEILPELSYNAEDVGIITPYRKQAGSISERLENKIDASTVHKFQGREKDCIIFCTTDDTVTEFSDDAQLINVAVSRAKKKFILVSNPKEQPAGSNIASLIGYIRYNNFEETQSSLCSIFDYLFSKSEESRKEYLSKHKKISDYDSENLFYVLIKEVFEELNLTNIGVACHYPLYMLLKNTDKLTEEEARFVNTQLSHIDFLLYNRTSRLPILAIEVDGSQHHNNEVQKHRDALKNEIMEKYSLRLERFETSGVNEKSTLTGILKETLGINV